MANNSPKARNVDAPLGRARDLGQGVATGSGRHSDNSSDDGAIAMMTKAVIDAQRRVRGETDRVALLADELFGGQPANTQDAKDPQRIGRLPQMDAEIARLHEYISDLSAQVERFRQL